MKANELIEKILEEYDEGSFDQLLEKLPEPNPEYTGYEPGEYEYFTIYEDRSVSTIDKEYMGLLQSFSDFEGCRKIIEFFGGDNPMLITYWEGPIGINQTVSVYFLDQEDLQKLTGD